MPPVEDFVQCSLWLKHSKLHRVLKLCSNRICREEEEARRGGSKDQQSICCCRANRASSGQVGRHFSSYVCYLIATLHWRNWGESAYSGYSGYRVSVYCPWHPSHLLNRLIQLGRVPVKRGEQLAAVAEAHAASQLWSGFILTLWQVPTAESPRQPGPQSGAQADVVKTGQANILAHPLPSLPNCELLLFPTRICDLWTEAEG